jgi:hypothetical protein
MSATVVSKCIFCVILASFLAAEAQEPIHATLSSAVFSGQHPPSVKAPSTTANASVGTTMLRKVQSSVLPAEAVQGTAVPRNPDMTLLASLGSAMLVLARLLRKVTAQRDAKSNPSPKVRAVAAGKAA